MKTNEMQGIKKAVIIHICFWGHNWLITRMMPSYYHETEDPALVLKYVFIAADSSEGLVFVTLNHK